MAERIEKKRRHWALRVLDAALLLATIALLVYFWPARFGGSTSFVVVGGHSMEPTYDIGDIVVLRKGDPQVGDVVAFDPHLQSPNAPLVIHRIVGGDPSGWITQGDNNPNVDPWKPTSDQVAGIAQFRIPGGLRVINLFQQPLFYGILAGIAGVVLLWPRKKPEEQPGSDSDDPPDPNDPAGPDGSDEVHVPEDDAGPSTGIEDPVEGAPELASVGRAAPKMRPATKAIVASGKSHHRKPRMKRASKSPAGRAAPKTPPTDPAPRAPEEPRRHRKPRTRRTTTALAGGAALLVVFSLISASAASMNVQADDLMAQMIPGDRCDDVISVEPGRSIGNPDPLVYDEVHFTEVAAACNGLNAEIAVIDADGNLLASGTGIAATSAFIVSFSTDVSIAEYSRTALVINGWGIPLVPVGDTIVSVPNITSDWETGYCATVTVSTTSPDPLPWTTTFDLSAFPLNGVPYEVSNANHTWNPPILHATPMPYNPTVKLGVPVTWSYCANRPPPPPAPAEWVMTMNNDFGNGYCAKIVVSTASLIPVTWNIEVPLDTYPFNGTPYNVSNATWSFSAPVLFASGAGWNNTVVAGQPRELQVCSNRPPNTPVPQSLSPSTLARGATNVNVAINGYNFENGATVSFSGTGITVNSVNFVGGWQLIANVTVAPTATLGARDIFVTNPGNVMGGKTSAFTVTN